MMKKKGEVFLMDRRSRSLSSGKTKHGPPTGHGQTPKGRYQPAEQMYRWVGEASSWSQAVTNPSRPDEGGIQKTSETAPRPHWGIPDLREPPASAQV